MCGIALSRQTSSVRVHQTQPLFVAGQRPAQRHVVLKLLRGVEIDLGWATENRVQQLLEDCDGDWDTACWPLKAVRIVP